VEIQFKIYIILIAGTIGLTIDSLLEFLFFQIQPSPLFIITLSLNWALMLKTNPVWKMLWEKWTKK
jgi:hypothetical protein